MPWRAGTLFWDRPWTAATTSSAFGGTPFPVRYSKVYFTLEFYDPTLGELPIEISVDGPDGWDLESDYDEIDLTPGESSLWNLSVTPQSGAQWQLGNPYPIDVDIDAGPEGQFSERLEVVLEEVSDVQASKEWSSINTVEGNIVPLNITFTNKGNRDETVSITLEAPQELTVNLTPMDRTLEPGESFTSRGEINVGEVEEAGTVSFSVKYSSSKGTTTLDYSLLVNNAEDDSAFNYIPVIIIAIVVIVLAIAGYFGYNRFLAGKTGEGGGGEKPRAQKAPPAEPPEKPAPQSRAKAYRSATREDEELIRKADDALASILGEDRSDDEPEVEKVEVLEATIVE